MSFRPRFGKGHRTALTAAVVLWMVSYVPLVNACYELAILGPSGAWIGLAWGILETSTAALAGGWVSDGRRSPGRSIAPP